MSELTKNINYIFGYVLLYSVIIFTSLSALFGGIVVYPIYRVICIIKKIRENCRKNEIQSEEEVKVVQTKKKPIIDENWCNVSVKNIINFENEIQNEIATNEIEAADVNLEEDISNTEVVNSSEAEVEDISNTEVVNSSEAEVEEEILSIRRPSEEELRKKEEEENESASEADANEIVDNSPNDKYSIGHYKSKTHINDPLDFDN
jgi:hypothetical protein